MGRYIIPLRNLNSKIKTSLLYAFLFVSLQLNLFLCFARIENQQCYDEYNNKNKH